MLRQISLLPARASWRTETTRLGAVLKHGFTTWCTSCPRSCDVEEVSWKSSFARWFFVADNMPFSSQRHSGG
jgi:hypothetical protein